MPSITPVPITNQTNVPRHVLARVNTLAKLKVGGVKALAINRKERSNALADTTKQYRTFLHKFYDLDNKIMKCENEGALSSNEGVRIIQERNSMVEQFLAREDFKIPIANDFSKSLLMKSSLKMVGPFYLIDAAMNPGKPDLLFGIIGISWTIANVSSGIFNKLKLLFGYTRHVFAGQQKNWWAII